jgi:hypothetical protein
MLQDDTLRLSAPARARQTGQLFYAPPGEARQPTFPSWGKQAAQQTRRSRRQSIGSLSHISCGVEVSDREQVDPDWPVDRRPGPVLSGDRGIGPGGTEGARSDHRRGDLQVAREAHGSRRDAQPREETLRQLQHPGGHRGARDPAREDGSRQRGRALAARPAVRRPAAASRSHRPARVPDRRRAEQPRREVPAGGGLQPGRPGAEGARDRGADSRAATGSGRRAAREGPGDDGPESTGRGARRSSSV